MTGVVLGMPTMSTHKGPALALLLLIAAGLSGTSCSPPDVTLVVLTVSGLTANDTTLQVDSTLDGQPTVPEQQTIPLNGAGTFTVGLRFAPGLRGSLVLDVTALATNPSDSAMGQVSTKLTGQQEGVAAGGTQQRIGQQGQAF